eukprot:scaffold29689_cov35-Cyclotella_meneghiniana.AAC.1
MVRSPGFGSITSDKRPIQARFHCGSSIHCLNLPLPMSRRLILQQARRQTLFPFRSPLLRESFLLSLPPVSCGGKRSRTADSRRAKAVLYQLSYTPAGPFWI